jgi:Tfp pilus assembly ATPase PilU
VEEALRNADSPNEVRLLIKLEKEDIGEELVSNLEGLTLEEHEEDQKGMMR